MWRRSGAGILLIGVALAAFASRSAAQDIVSSSAAIRACLCEEQRVEALSDVMKQRQQSYEQQRDTLDSLTNQLRTRRAQINVNDPAEVDAFRQLLAQRDQAAQQFSGAATDAYTQAVAAYNQAAGDYNGSCAGRAYDQQVLAEVKRDLYCPRR